MRCLTVWEVASQLCFAGLLGCAPAGVTEIVLGPPIVAGASAPKNAGAAGRSAAAGGGGVSAPSTAIAAVSGGSEATTAPPSTGSTTSAVMAGAPPIASSAAGTSGSAVAAGSGAAGMGGSLAAGSGGTPGMDMDTTAPADGACPQGWMCVDPVASSPIPGLLFTDVKGEVVPYTCSDGSMMVIDCDDANPMASCKALDNPICAHINVAGMSLTACAQRCHP